jgi:hypothetical protein
MFGPRGTAAEALPAVVEAEYVEDSVEDPALAAALDAVDATGAAPVEPIPSGAEGDTTVSTEARIPVSPQPEPSAELPPEDEDTEDMPSPVVRQPAPLVVPPLPVPPPEPAAQPRVPEPPPVPTPVTGPTPDAGTAAKAKAYEAAVGAAPAEKALGHGFAAIAAETERRKNSGRLKRFAAWAGAIGAFVAATAWGAYEYLHRDSADAAPSADLPAEHMSDTATDIGGDSGIEEDSCAATVDANTPAPEAQPHPPHVDTSIGKWEGVSHGFLHMGLTQDQMQHELNKTVQIGDRTVQLRDTFVIAGPDKLKMHGEWQGDQLTGTHFAANGHDLGPQELAKFLSVAPQVDPVSTVESTPDPVAAPHAAVEEQVNAILDSVDQADEPVETVVAPDAPTEAMPDRMGMTEADTADAPTEVVAERATEIIPDRPTELMPERQPEYTDQIRELDALLQQDADGVVELGARLQFRKQNGLYEVHLMGAKDFDPLTPEMLQGLHRIANLDFQQPITTRVLTNEEYASLLPDDHEYKERVRHALNLQIEAAREHGMQDLEAERRLRVLEGDDTGPGSATGETKE